MPNTVGFVQREVPRIFNKEHFAIFVYVIDILGNAYFGSPFVKNYDVLTVHTLLCSGLFANFIRPRVFKKFKMDALEIYDKITLNNFGEMVNLKFFQNPTENEISSIINLLKNSFGIMPAPRSYDGRVKRNADKLAIRMAPRPMQHDDDDLGGNEASYTYLMKEPFDNVWRDFAKYLGIESNVVMPTGDNLLEEFIVLNVSRNYCFPPNAKIGAFVDLYKREPSYMLGLLLVCLSNINRREAMQQIFTTPDSFVMELHGVEVTFIGMKPRQITDLLHFKYPKISECMSKHLYGKHPCEIIYPKSIRKLIAYVESIHKGIILSNTVNPMFLKEYFSYFPFIGGEYFVDRERQSMEYVRFKQRLPVSKERLRKIQQKLTSLAEHTQIYNSNKAMSILNEVDVDYDALIQFIQTVTIDPLLNGLAIILYTIQYGALPMKVSVSVDGINYTDQDFTFRDIESYLAYLQTIHRFKKMPLEAYSKLEWIDIYPEPLSPGVSIGDSIKLIRKIASYSASTKVFSILTSIYHIPYAILSNIAYPLPNPYEGFIYLLFMLKCTNLTRMQRYWLEKHIDMHAKSLSEIAKQPAIVDSFPELDILLDNFSETHNFHNAEATHNYELDLTNIHHTDIKHLYQYYDFAEPTLNTIINTPINQQISIVNDLFTTNDILFTHVIVKLEYISRHLHKVLKTPVASEPPIP